MEVQLTFPSTRPSKHTSTRSAISGISFSIGMPKNASTPSSAFFDKSSDSGVGSMNGHSKKGDRPMNGNSGGILPNETVMASVVTSNGDGPIVKQNIVKTYEYTVEVDDFTEGDSLLDMDGSDSLVGGGPILMECGSSGGESSGGFPYRPSLNSPKIITTDSSLTPSHPAIHNHQQVPPNRPHAAWSQEGDARHFSGDSNYVGVGGSAVRHHSPLSSCNSADASYGLKRIGLVPRGAFSSSSERVCAGSGDGLSQPFANSLSPASTSGLTSQQSHVREYAGASTRFARQTSPAYEGLLGSGSDTPEPSSEAVAGGGGSHGVRRLVGMFERRRSESADRSASGDSPVTAESRRGNQKEANGKKTESILRRPRRSGDSSGGSLTAAGPVRRVEKRREGSPSYLHLSCSASGYGSYVAYSQRVSGTASSSSTQPKQPLPADDSHVSNQNTCTHIPTPAPSSSISGWSVTPTDNPHSPSSVRTVRNSAGLSTTFPVYVAGQGDGGKPSLGLLSNGRVESVGEDQCQPLREHSPKTVVTVNGPAMTVNGPAMTVNGPAMTVNGPAMTVNGSVPAMGEQYDECFKDSETYELPTQGASVIENFQINGQIEFDRIKTEVEEVVEVNGIDTVDKVADSSSPSNGDRGDTVPSGEVVCGGPSQSKVSVDIAESSIQEEDAKVNVLPELSNLDGEIPQSNGNTVIGSRESTCTSDALPAKNASWFMERTASVECELFKMRDLTQSHLDSDDMSDEVSGILRAAIGKANLLVTKKFKQFRGLCTKNMTQTAEEEFPATEEDLAGFWDMMGLQIDELREGFREIETLRAAGWKVEEKAKKKVARRNSRSLNSSTDGSGKTAQKTAVSSVKAGKEKPGAPKSDKENARAKAREEARKRLIAAKRAMRQRRESVEDATEEVIFISK